MLKNIFNEEVSEKSQEQTKREVKVEDPFKLRLELFSKLASTTSFIKKQAMINHYDEIIRVQSLQQLGTYLANKKKSNPKIRS